MTLFSRPHQREERHDLRGVARGGGDRADPALQRCDALLQHRHGGVGQPGIDIADLLEVEEGGGMVGIAEYVTGGLVDRRLPRTGRRIGAAAGVNMQRVKAIGGVGHGGPRLACFGMPISAAGYVRRERPATLGRRGRCLIERACVAGVHRRRCTR